MHLDSRRPRLRRDRCRHVINPKETDIELPDTRPALPQPSAPPRRRDTYPAEDSRTSRAAGYLPPFVPAEFGGAGSTLTEIAAEQTYRPRRHRAPPRINMHQIIVGPPLPCRPATCEASGPCAMRPPERSRLRLFPRSPATTSFGSTTRATPTCRGIFLRGNQDLHVPVPVDPLARLRGPRPGGGPAFVPAVQAIGLYDPGPGTLGARATQSMTTLQGGGARGSAFSRHGSRPQHRPGHLRDLLPHFQILLAATQQGVGDAVECGGACNEATRRRTPPDIRHREAALLMNARFGSARDIDAGVGPRSVSDAAAVGCEELSAAAVGRQAMGQRHWLPARTVAPVPRSRLLRPFSRPPIGVTHAAWANLTWAPIDKAGSTGWVSRGADAA